MRIRFSRGFQIWQLKMTFSIVHFCLTVYYTSFKAVDQRVSDVKCLDGISFQSSARVGRGFYCKSIFVD